MDQNNQNGFQPNQNNGVFNPTGTFQPTGAPQNGAEEEKLVPGILGALAGAVIGSIIFIVVTTNSQKIYSVIGIILGVLIAFGYKLLGKKLSVMGGAICALIALIATYISFRIAYGLMLYDALSILDSGLTKMDCIKNAKDYLDTLCALAGEKSTYTQDLITSLIFGFGGAIAGIVAIMKGKTSGLIRRR